MFRVDLVWMFITCLQWPRLPSLMYKDTATMTDLNRSSDNSLSRLWVLKYTSRLCRIILTCVPVPHKPASNSWPAPESWRDNNKTINKDRADKIYRVVDQDECPHQPSMLFWYTSGNALDSYRLVLLVLRDNSSWRNPYTTDHSKNNLFRLQRSLHNALCEVSKSSSSSNFSLTKKGVNRRNR